MYEFHPYFTNDGSVGLYSPEFNDIYHSATGALTEAYEKFILPVDMENLLKKDSIKVLDICYGIGYNSKSFLNFIFEKYFLKNSKKKFQHAEHNIEARYTNNNSINKNQKSCLGSTEYIEQVYANNIFSKIYIKSVDNDKNLFFLSPFVKTGVKNFKNNNFDFEYKNLDKYLKKERNKNPQKINKLINYVIFEKLLENYPEILKNNDTRAILNSKRLNQYFDSNLKGIYEFYHSRECNYSLVDKIKSFLHNIYYQHVSNCYKKGLKRYQLQDFIFDPKIGDARKIIINDTNLYNLIFLDAFTPSKCPCLWSYEFFKLLYEHLEDDGMILTYSTSAAIRAAMTEAGFFIGNIYNERENKLTGTVAVKKNNLIKHELSEFDLGLLKTTAGIFYRDENLTSQNEAIIENRKFEIQNSNRISTSSYKKSFKNL
ncbi:MAG: hypothetical protein K2F57_01085 [Candidatus Gastranaerophilales bacterium]|nr:hypothetical protein [Candidatus Gastranaerophilales bacterium]